MTTIILVTVGILLAAVSALFIIFYGGNAFNQSDDKAEAARLVGEGVQIQAAFQAFRAQEDRMPGVTGTGVDSVALWDLKCNKYLTQVPKGTNVTAPTFDCDHRPSASAATDSPWKIDYNFGIARSVLGAAKNSDGSSSKAYNVCQAARRQMGLISTAVPDPLRCDDPSITNKEPCCIMSDADAKAS